MRLLTGPVLAFVLSMSSRALGETPLDKKVSDANAALQAKDYVAATRLFQEAERLLYESPSVDTAKEIQSGLAKADAALIRDAVTTLSKVAGKDREALEELHRLHLRLRSVGGDDKIAEEIVRAMNIRASLLLDPHEKTEAITDIKPVLQIARFPELSDSARKRLATLAAKPWRIYNNRAQASAPLVAKTFTGLAARISGAAAESQVGFRDQLVFPFRRGSNLEVTAAGTCANLRPEIATLSQAGGQRVDAAVTVTKCTESSRTERRKVIEDYIIQIPYQVEEDVQEQICSEVRVPVRYCTNPYVNEGCVGSSDTATRYECSTVTRRTMVTRYREEPAKREVEKTLVYTTYNADVAWTATYNGQTIPGNASLSVTHENGKGDRLDKKVADAVRNALDAPVAAFIDKRASELRAEADAALADGKKDEGEAALLHVVLLGRSAGDYFKRTYFVSDDELRQALLAKPATKPLFQSIEVEPLPPITDARKDAGIRLIRDRLAAQFPPQMSRVQGFWYNAELGAITAPTTSIAGADVGGGTAAAFGLRFGTPFISRIHGRTEGFGIWDDLAIGGNLGYTVSAPQDGKRGVGARGIATYAAALGYRARVFQILAGARATASVFKLGGSTGSSTTLQYYGNIGGYVGYPSLTLEAWWYSPVGMKSRGAQLYFTAPTEQSQYKQQLEGSGHGNATSYLALRVEEERYKGCLAGAATCADSNDMQIISAMLAFGASFF